MISSQGRRKLSLKGVMLGIVVGLISTSPVIANMCAIDGGDGLMTDTTYTPDSLGGVSLNKTLTLLNGIDDIQGAAYDPVKGEIVFVGQGEIPLAEQIEMDDLVVAMRTIYNVNASGVTGDPGINFVAASDWEITRMDDVEYLGATQNTQFGQILFDADYLLKTLGQGVDKDGVMVRDYTVPPSVASSTCPSITNPTFATCFGYQSAAERWIVNSIDLTVVGGVGFWFEPSTVELDVDQEDGTFKFKTVAMHVDAKVKKLDGTNATSAEFPIIYSHADAFASTITNHYDAIAEIPGFEVLKKLKRLAKIVAVVRWLRDNNIPVDLTFLASYVPDGITTPTKVNLLQLCGTGATVDSANSGAFTSGSSCGTKIVGGVLYQTENNEYDILSNPLMSAAVTSTSRVLNAHNSDDMAWNFDYSGGTYQGIAQTVATSEKEGNVAGNTVDLVLPNRAGQPLALTRYYDSFSNLSSGFGPGWSELPFSLIFPEAYSVICPPQFKPCNLESPYTTVDPVRIILTDRLTGKAIQFDYAELMSWEGGTVFTPLYLSSESNDVIYRDHTSGYFVYEQLNTNNQLTKKVLFLPQVNENGLKVEASLHYVVVPTNGGDEGSNGIWLQYMYDAQNRLEKIVNLVGGAGINFDYLGNRISRAWYTVPDGTREVHYNYNSGRLETVDRSGNILKYTYADSADVSSGVVSAVEDLTRRELVFDYITDLESRATVSRAEDNNALSVTSVYDRETGLTTHTDSLGREMTVARDGYNRLEGVSRLAEVDGVTTTLSTSRLYEDTNLLAGPTTVYDARNNSTTYTYDEAGQITSVTDALGRTTTIERGIEPADGNASVIVTTDPKGRTSMQKFDTYGRLVASYRRVGISNKVTNTEEVLEFTFDYSVSGGYSQSVNYDSTTGKVSSVTNDASQMTLLYPWITANETTQYTNFNSFGIAETVTSPAGYATQIGYDTLARQRTVQGPADIVATTTNYQESGLAQDSVSSVTTALGTSTQIQDVVNRKRSVTDARGITTHYIYNKKSQLERVVEVSPTASTILTTQYIYDDFGKLSAKYLPNGSKVEYFYDGFDRLQEMREVENTGSNAAPLISDAPSASNVVDANTGFSFDLNATDENGDNVNYYLVSGPEGMVVDALTGMITWAPSAGQTGNYTVVIQITDGNGGLSDVVFDVDVQGEDSSYSVPILGYQWTKTLASTFADYVQAADVHEDGGLYISARLGSEVTIKKYDNLGGIVWERTYGGSGDVSVNSIQIGESSVYVVGTYSGTVDFDYGGLGDSKTTVANNKELFITKINNDNKYVWTRTHNINYTEDQDYSRSVLSSTMNSSEYIYVLVHNRRSSFVPDNIDNKYFISTYNLEGEHQWVKPTVKSSFIEIDDSGALYLAGSFRGVKDFDPGVFTDDLSSGDAGREIMFFSIYDASGNYLKTTVSAHPFYWGNTKIKTFKIDRNKILIAGIAEHEDDNHIKVSVYDIDGNALWHSNVRGDNSIAGAEFDSEGNVYLSGEYSGYTNLYDSTDRRFVVARFGHGSYLYMFDSNGLYVWGSKNDTTKKPLSLIGNDLGYLYELGIYAYTPIDFDPYLGVDEHTPIGSWDIFISSYMISDYDNDGIPSKWEILYGLNPYLTLDSSLDADGDSFTNLQEFQNGTDPTVVDTIVLSPDIYSIEVNAEDTALNVLSNDTVAESTSLSITSVTSPTSGGSASINANNDGLIYTPAANYTGIDSFTYTATDGATSKTATVTINVIPALALVAEDASFNMERGASYSGLLPATDASAGVLYYVVTSSPSNGAISITDVETGAFTYTPNSGYVGTDSFDFQVYNDASLASNIATVTVTVTGATPSNDIDTDGMPDSWEITHFGDISQPAEGDFDADGVSNYQEYLDGTNPTVSDIVTDSDADGLLDDWEISYFGNLSQSAWGDYDYDSLSNIDEYVDGTDPTVRNPQAGTYAWTRTITGDEKEYGRAVAVDSQGNVYVGGNFYSSSIDFDSNGAGDIRTKIGNADAYLTKVNADGSYAWTRTISGVGGSANIASIAIDELDNVFVAGTFSGVVNFDVGGAGDIYTSTNGSNAFISKLQAYTGDYIATHTYIGSAYISDIAIGGGKLYAVGGYSGDVDFTPATVGNEYNSLYGYSIHVTQLNTDLSHSWTRVFNTSEQGAFANARAVVADSLGGVYLLGQFSGFIDLSVEGLGASYTSTLDLNGYALKLSVDGGYVWSRTVPFSVDGDITLGEDDSVYIAGRYSRTVDFDPNGGDVHTSGDNQADIYLTRVNAIDGSYVSTRVFTNDNYAEYVYAVASVGKYVLIGTKSDGRFYNSSGRDARLIATSPELPDWTYSVGTYQQESIEDIAVAPDASVYLVGNFVFSNNAVDASVDFNRYVAPDYHQSSPYGGVFLTKRTFASEDVCGINPLLILYKGECADDADSDGMPDAWEIQYFGDITQAATGDYDADGVSNLQEYLDGTDPTVAATNVTELIGQYEYGWVKTFGHSTSSYSDIGEGVATDSDGNIYVVGYFQGSVNFDRYGTNDTHVSIGKYDAFITRINADGSYGWTRTIGGTNNDFAYDVAIDDVGNVYVVGMYVGSADFDIGGAGHILTPGGRSARSYISKYQANTGAHVGTYAFSNTSVRIYDIAISGETLYVGGATSTGAYVAQLNTNFNLAWTRTFNGGSNVKVNSLAVDSDGNVYLAGIFSVSIDLSVAGIGTSYAAVNHLDGFVLKLNSDGSYGWSHSFAGQGYGVALNETQDVLYITGGFSGTVDFNAAGLGDTHSSAGGSIDIFLTQRQANNGDYVSTRIAGDLGYEEGYAVASIGSYVFVGGRSDWSEAHIAAFSAELGDWSYTVGNRQTAIYDIAIAPNGNLYSTGYFNGGNYKWGSARFDPNSHASTHSQGFGDVFITEHTFAWDRDQDGVPDRLDAFPYDPTQTTDTDGDGIGDGFDLDIDGDGMPNTWETTYGFNPLDATDAALDSDGDGQNNLAEYLAGTDPTMGITSVTNLLGQYEYGWVKTFGSSTSRDGDIAKGVATDSAGNIYVVGDFRDTVNFDLYRTNDTHSSMGYFDAFITRINADGSYGWTRTIGGTSQEHAYDIEVDDSGNVYVVGRYFGSADFDIGGVGHTPTVGSRSWHSYISKYQANSGDFVGTYVFSDTSVEIYDVAISGDRLYASGAISVRGYVAQLDTNLSLVWSRSFNGGNVMVNGVTTDNGGNAYLTGTFGTSIDLSVNGFGTTHTAVNNLDGFVLKLNSNGSYGWSHSFAGQGHGVALNEAQDILYITGGFSGTVDFNAAGLGDSHTSAGGAQDIFLTQRRANNGDYIGTRITGVATKYEIAYSVASIGSYVFVGGQANWNEAYIAAFSAELGDWSYSVGYRQTAIYDIAIAPNGNLYSTGHFNGGGGQSGSAKFDPNRNIYTRSQGYGDVFITEHTFVWDSDQDGVPDTVDAFPNDPTRW